MKRERRYGKLDHVLVEREDGGSTAEELRCLMSGLHVTVVVHQEYMNYLSNCQRDLNSRKAAMRQLMRGHIIIASTIGASLLP